MISLEDICVRFPGAGDVAVDGASLEVNPGEVLTLIGANGAGKSSLARVLNGTVATQSGRVLIDGRPASRSDLRRLVGFVRQDPESQLVSSVVFDEVAFGPCNLGLAPDEVRGRVVRSLAECGIEGLARRGVSTLSGGELQRVAIAGVLAMRPAFLVLDEATSMLDGTARRQLRAIVRRLAGRGVGIVMVSHDVEDLLCSDRVAVVESGRLTWRGGLEELLRSDDLCDRACLPPGRLVRALRRAAAAGVALGPDYREVARSAGRLQVVRPILDALESPASNYACEPNAVAPTGGGACQRGIELCGVCVRYGALHALDGVTMAARAGRILLVAGRSGSGKSTASRVAAGLLKPDEGTALVAGERPRPGRVGLCLQRSEDQLFCDTVADDVAYGPKSLGVGGTEALSRAHDALAEMGVSEDLWNRSPFALSGGQRRRAALAGVRALDPAAYVLDEPTVGLDARARELLHEVARRAAGEGRPVIVVSHDIDEWLDVADDVALLREGRVAWRGPSRALADDPSPLVDAGLMPPAWMRLRDALRREVARVVG